MIKKKKKKLAMSQHFLTLNANTTLNKIMVGISLFGEGSVLETYKKKNKKKNYFSFCNK